MPWPAVVSENSRQKRQTDRPLDQIFHSLTSHPLNSDRPAVSEMEPPLTASDVESKLSSLIDVNQFNIDPIYQVNTSYHCAVLLAFLELA